MRSPGFIIPYARPHLFKDRLFTTALQYNRKSYWNFEVARTLITENYIRSKIIPKECITQKDRWPYRS